MAMAFLVAGGKRQQSLPLPFLFPFPIPFPFTHASDDIPRRIAFYAMKLPRDCLKRKMICLWRSPMNTPDHGRSESMRRRYIGWKWILWIINTVGWGTEQHIDTCLHSNNNCFFKRRYNNKSLLQYFILHNLGLYSVIARIQDQNLVSYSLLICWRRFWVLIKGSFTVYSLK